MKSRSILKIASDNLDELIQRSLENIRTDEFKLSIYFGKNMANRYEKLCKELERIYHAPMLRAHFVKNGKWTLRKISPIGLLFICAVLGCVGLNMVSGITTFAGALVALSVYALGKTFFWPTMLAVTSDRFPRTGAIAISIMGGCGMMSAGLLGSAGLGYAKDRYAGEALQKANPAIYAAYKAEKPSTFLFLAPVNGLDGTKLSAAQGSTNRTPEQTTVVEASIVGDRQTLKADSFIPATMAVIYLLLFFYFKAIGGYRTLSLAEVKKA
jgi:MFS family permease